MDQILIIVAFLLGYKLGRDNKIFPDQVVDKVKNIGFMKQKTKVFQDGGVKEGSKEKAEEEIFNKDLEF